VSDALNRAQALHQAGAGAPPGRSA
jgi:hypothetical protein